jgi:kumamolisin
MFKSYIKRHASPAASFDAKTLAQRYGYPEPGKHPVNVAIISLGGGYAWADVKGYCTKYGLSVPSVRDYSVDGAKNQYTGDPNSADGENALDIQNILGATLGKVGIRIFIAQNTDASFAKAVQAVANMNTCVAVSISWGLDEKFGNHSAMNTAISHCKNLNIPVFCASGDNGSSDGDPGKNVDFPASSPFAVGAGGTTLGPRTEVVWADGGGGVSKLYKKNPWQPIGLMRGVPDMAANADPNTGYPILLNGTWYTFGGTSAVGPMLVAGVACVASNTTQRIKNFIETIYASKLATDITQGNNGAYNAGPGFDYCTGLGVPNAAFWSQFKKL